MDKELKTVTLGLWFIHRDGEHMPLQDFVNMANRVLARVPEESRASAVVRAEGYSDYFSGEIEIVYVREETDEEHRVRLESEQKCERESEERERAEFERLKKKFEP